MCCGGALMYIFTINDAQEKQWAGWRAEHEKTCPAKPDVSMAQVKCPCGGKVHLNAGEDEL